MFSFHVTRIMVFLLASFGDEYMVSLFHSQLLSIFVMFLGVTLFVSLGMSSGLQLYLSTKPERYINRFVDTFSCSMDVRLWRQYDVLGCED